MHAPGIFQLVLIIVLVLLLFGSRRIPEFMENMAKGVKAFKKGMQDEDKKDNVLTSKSEKDD